MRKQFLCLMVLCLTSLLHAEPSAVVYEQDGETLFDNRSVPIGTELSIMVISDVWETGKAWGGTLATIDDNLSRGVLSPHLNDYDLSVLSGAGKGAFISEWDEPGIYGFDMYTSAAAKAGNWFILDFTAVGTGLCEINFYRYVENQTYPNPSIMINIIPEPTLCALLGIGSLLLIRRQQAPGKNRRTACF